MPPSEETPILQACAVPYRRQGGRLEVCLVTSISKGRWGFPKGIIDPGETPAETALKEAREEAGLQGVIEGGSLGQYADFKWGTELIVTGLLMRVTVAADDWDEADVRQRCWCSPGQAGTLIHRYEQRHLLDEALKRLGAETPPTR